MNRQYISRFVLSLACLGLTGVVFADSLLTPVESTTDWITHPWMDMESKHKCYKVENMKTGRMMYLDRVGNGVRVMGHGQMTHNLDELVGWKITCLKTGKTGIIVGVKHRGLRDVKSSDKHITRYEYVVFKVKHVHYVK
jgi:hypothetical protein